MPNTGPQNSQVHAHTSKDNLFLNGMEISTIFTLYTNIKKLLSIE
jgi:hypothetical protein